MDGRIASDFARGGLLTDHRADVGRRQVPALTLQTSGDILVRLKVSAWLAWPLPHGRPSVTEATGYRLHLGTPNEPIPSFLS
jgi:pimeloyl-ACP methyl ester carboxylesterase